MKNKAIRYARVLPLKFVIFLVPVCLMAVLTVGTVVSLPVNDFVTGLISDPTFTGRSDVWKFALEHMREHPWIGYGFDTFWNMSNLINGGYELETWAATAGHAHNDDSNQEQHRYFVEPSIEHMATSVFTTGKAFYLCATHVVIANQ